jgi:hypothetical protein
MGYLIEINFLQLLHLHLSKIKESRGILSNQEIFFLHLGQNELPFTKLMFFGKRYEKQLIKDPSIKPIKVTKK